MVGRPRKPISDPVLQEWLGEFKKRTTKGTYLTALRTFKKNLGIADLTKYLKSEPDPTKDLKKFLISLDGKPSKTIHTYTSALRVFFQDHSLNVEYNDWRKLKRRGFMPKRIRAETRDKKPSKSQLKQILNYADIKLRALTLFLTSSGARIGETLQLLIEDFDLDAEPPRVHIRAEFTKGGLGGRTVYFSYEARDAIKDWLRIKNKTGKRSRGTYEDPKMFPWVHSTAVFMWNMACDKAGMGAKDKGTGRRIYHLHSLRKFFRTKIGLDLDITHALMGHSEYLDAAYVRQDGDEIAKAYLEAMPNVSVYAVQDAELKQETEHQKVEIETLQKEVIQLRASLHRVFDLNDTRKDVNARFLLELQQNQDKLNENFKMLEKSIRVLKPKK